MLVQNIYKRRFSDTKERNILWKTLVEDFFQEYIKKTDTVLDLPSGYCEFINNVKCRKKIAIDINPDSKKYVSKNIKFIHGKSSNTTLNKSTVDKIFVSNFFEHITREEIIKTIVEFKRILKKNGRVLILQPNIRFLSRDYWMFFDHITPIDDRALTEVFNSQGFKLVKKIEKFLPYTTKSRFPKLSIFVKLYLKLPFLWQFFGKQSFLIYQI